MKKVFYIFILLFGLNLIFTDLDAQCPMCRASAETSLESGSTNVRGINKGIMYLFATPYLILGTIGFFWWRANRMNSSEA